MSDDVPALNVIALIKEAAASPKMRSVARQTLAELITDGDLLAHQERKKEIRPSDFGSCTLALWATIHGLEDLPRDPIDDTLARLDLGSLVGAWEACLLAASESSDWHFLLEHVPEGGGHIDVLATHKQTGEHVPIEFKSTYSKPTVPIKPPEKDNASHLLQLGDYANRVKPRAERMILVYIKPPADAGNRMKQFERPAAPFVGLVAEERKRLERALLDEQPQADPQAAYSCWTCRWSGCNKNKNKAANSAELLFA